MPWSRRPSSACGLVFRGIKSVVVGLPVPFSTMAMFDLSVTSLDSKINLKQKLTTKMPPRAAMTLKIVVMIRAILSLQHMDCSVSFFSDRK